MREHIGGGESIGEVTSKGEHTEESATVEPVGIEAGGSGDGPLISVVIASGEEQLGNRHRHVGSELERVDGTARATLVLLTAQRAVGLPLIGSLQAQLDDLGHA